jgi:lysophospholipase L1-like esterase
VAWDGTILASYIRGPYFYEKTYTYIELSRGLFNLLYRLAPPKPLPPDSGGVYYVMGHEAYLMDQTRIESGWARMLASLKAVNDLLRLHDVSPLVVIMPSRFAFDPPTESPQNRFARGLVNRAVEFARQNDIPYLDLTETIAAVGGEKVYLDTVHPNEKGNLAVGSALYEYLKTRVGP